MDALMQLVKDGVLSITEYERITSRQKSQSVTTGLSVIKLVNDFKGFLLDTMQKNTVSGYFTDTKSFLEFLLKVEDITKINYKLILPTIHIVDVQSWINSLSMKGYDTSSIRRSKHSVFKFFEFLEQKHDIKCPDITNIDVPKEEAETELHALTDKEIRQIADHALLLRDKCVILFMYETGMRRQELIECEKEHVDFNNCTVKIFSKGKLDRIGNFSKATGELLKQYLKEFKEEVRDINNKRRANAKNNVYSLVEISKYLFQTLRSPMMSYATVFKGLKDASKEFFLHKTNSKDEAIKMSEMVNTEVLRQSRTCYWLASDKTVEQVQTIMGIDNYWRCKRFMKIAQQLYPNKF